MQSLSSMLGYYSFRDYNLRGYSLGLRILEFVNHSLVSKYHLGGHTFEGNNLGSNNLKPGFQILRPINHVTPTITVATVVGATISMAAASQATASNYGCWVLPPTHATVTKT